nr:flagellar hook-length control protein FliK [Halomonas olivaria]
MHQVLGRQGEVSLQRSLNAPIQPIPPGEGPRALQGDAKLDGRPMALPLDDLKRLPPSPDGQRLPSQGGQNGEAPGSTQTHFSPAARTIADVLLRFPAPPAVLRPEVPLMSHQDAPSSSILASRLEASIRDSGLFYESHLKRWFQGDASRQQLLREPQMQPGPRPLLPPSAISTAVSLTPASPSASAVGNMSILPNTLLVPVTSDRPVPERTGGGAGNMSNTNTSPLAEVRASGQASVELNGARELAEVAAMRGRREVVHENLQSLVRQQLEMLVMPVIRWEGDVWAGIFLALVINLPAREEGREDGNDADSERGWYSEMQLEVPNVGAFSVSVRLYQSVLNIDLATDSLFTHGQLEQGLGALEQRLSALDFRKVQLRVRHVALEEHHDGVG